MSQFYPAFLTIAFAIAGWLIIPRITIRLQSAARRRHFGSYLETLKRGVASHKPQEFTQSGRAHRIKDIEVFNPEERAVRPHITSKTLKCFDEACASYRAITFDAHISEKESEQKKAQLIMEIERMENAVK